MNNETDIGIKFTANVSGNTKLEKLATNLSTIKAAADGINTGTINSLQDSADATKDIQKDTSTMAKTMKLAFNYSAVKVFARQIQGLTRQITKLTNKTSEYLENYNLFQVAFKGNYESAEKFINKLSEMYGLDESRLTRVVGLFKQLGNAMNVSDETGEKLAKLMTQMSLDISSLYNVDFERATSVLQSAFSGQTKPIRGTTGADITQATLQTTLDNLGIERMVDQLSFAEKRLLIIISLTQQLRAATNDLGRTIESPANQMKILSEQWERLSRAVGNLFIGALKHVLPYLNAILMVLTAIINSIAKLLGYKKDDFDYFDKPSASVKNLDTGLGKATKSANSLKKALSGLRGFDKLNVISSPSNAGSYGGAGGGAGGISPDLLNAFDDAYENYQKQLDNVKMKATKIRDKIMEWLGFTKQVDEKTGEVSWKFSHITGGTVLGALAAGGVIFKGVSKIVKLLQKLGFLKFPIISKLVKLVGGSGKEAADAIGAAGEIGSASQKASAGLKVPSVTTILKGLADVALIIGGCTAIIAAMGLIAKIPGVADTVHDGIELTSEVFWGLAKMAIPLAAVSALVGVMGNFGVKQFLAGLADLAIIIIGCEAVITAVGMIAKIPYVGEFISSGIDTTQKIIKGIAEVIIPISLIGGALALAGLTGGAGAAAIATGLADFALIVGGLEVVLAALGALNSIPGFSWLVDKGMDLLLKLADFIGEFAGRIVKSLTDTVAKSLPNLGTKLSEFMINAMPFFENASKIDKNAMQGINALATALLKLTANEILDSLTKWFTGGSSLTEFGKDLATFGPLFAKYADSVKGIDGKVVQASANAASAMAKFGHEIPNKGGLVSLFTGDNTVSDFGKDLKAFGPDFKKYANSVAGIPASVVTESADAASAVAKFSALIPNRGGLVSLFTGDNTLSKWGKDLKDFGPNFKKYYSNIVGIDASIVTDSGNAVKTLAKFSDLVPNSGGLKSLFSGDNKISSWGKQLAKFGSYFKEYYGYIKSINTEKVDVVTDSLTSLVKQAKKIKDDGTKKTIKDFAKNLKKAAPDIRAFYENSLSKKEGESIGKDFGKGIADAIVSKIKNTKFPSLKLTGADGKAIVSYSIKTYAQGGLPKIGQLFVANEKGPELVGSMGGQSFVANQNQIGNFIDKKLGKVENTQPTNQIYNIYLDKNNKIATYTLEQLQSMAKTNGKPIRIG